MARVITMFKKSDSLILEDLKKTDRARAGRVMAALKLRVKESIIKKAVATNNGS